MYYVFTDSHFAHENIRKYCNRPDNCETRMINNLYKLKSTDTLIHLGDVYYFREGVEPFIKQMKNLPCKKILVKGNHDRNSDNWYVKYGGFDWVVNSFSLKYGKMEILFSHKPRYDLEAGVDLVIHGHLHNNNVHNEYFDYLVHNKSFLIAVEYTDYAPINLDKVIRQFKEKEPYASI